MTLLERDQKVIWHPYTQHGLEENPLAAKSAKGAWITLENGKQILDAISSWWVNIHGHAHPELSKTLSQQAEVLDHILFAGFTHEPAVALAEILVKAMKERHTSLEKVFFSDNGSTAVEVALKMAFQYHVNKSKKPRPRFLALHGAYHGDTFGAMAVGEPAGFHSIFRSLLPQVDFIKPGNINSLQELVEKNKDEYAAFIFEPLVQGAGGMVMYDKQFLVEAQKICRENNILLICDEVFTGFYRTGLAFAFEHAGLDPDFICVSKGITGGYLPLAATLTTRNVFETFLSQDVSRAFLHGHSYTANPIACAVAITSWNLLQSKETQANIKNLNENTSKAIAKFEKQSLVSDPRSLGTIGAVTMNFDLNYMSSMGRWFKTKAIEKGVLLRPLGRVLYAVPPYCVTTEEVGAIYKTINDLIEEYAETL
jgi:adenosylmethionine---8-amino-7-oxononanoate aminotransferase